jgi:outer membrane protein assembly factor BamB
MKNRTLIRAAIVCGLLVSTAAVVSSQDWPQWRGANSDAKVDGFKAPKTWPAQLTQKWKQTVGSGDTTPALVGDRLFVLSRVGAEENVICLNAADGKEIWRQKYAAPTVTGASASAHSGPRSSPAVADGKVVTFGVTGILTCWNATDGKQIWQKKDATTWPQFYAAASPLITGGLCIAQVGGNNDGGVAAYDLTTGDQKWKWTGGGPGYASPVAMTVGGTKIIVAVTSKSVVAISLADGKGLWTTPFTVTGMGYNASTPIVDGDTMIYAGQGRGIHAVKFAKQGDAITGTELWSAPSVSPQFNTAVLKDGFLYGLTQQSAFFCVNEKTGAVAWSNAATPAPGRGAAGYGSVVDAGSVLLALTPTSQLYVMQPNEKAFTQVAAIKVADTASFAYPVVSGNRIFIRDSNSVALLTVE